MDSYMARPRYAPRRPPAVQNRRRTTQTKGWLRRLILLQTFICIILLLMIVIIKGIHISATNFLSEQVDYVLGYNVELDSIFDYVGNLAADVRNSIAPGSVKKPGDEGLLASEDSRTTGENRNTDGSRAAESNQNTIDSRTTDGNLAAEENLAANAENATGDRTADTSIEFSGNSDRTADSSGETTAFTDGSDLAGSTDGSPNENSTDSTDSAESTDNTAYETGSEIGEAVSHPQTSVLAASSEETAQELPEMTAPAYGPVDTLFGSISSKSKGKLHNGIDIGLKPGGSVVAAADGEVAETGISPEYGAFIRLVHKGGWQTVYAGCTNFTVQKGAKINRGDVVARIGNSAISVGYHLHFEVWQDGKPVNPLEYISVDAY